MVCVGTIHKTFCSVSVKMHLSALMAGLPELHILMNPLKLFEAQLITRTLGYLALLINF